MNMVKVLKLLVYLKFYHLICLKISNYKFWCNNTYILQKLRDLLLQADKLKFRGENRKKDAIKKEGYPNFSLDLAEK